VTPRNRMILAIVGVILFLLAGYFFLVKPRQTELTEVKQQIEDAETLTTQLRVELQHRLDLQAREPQLRAQLARVRDLVPQTDEVANFVFQVQDEADKAGVTFVQVTPELPEPPLEGAALAEIDITIRANGGYFAIQDFVRRLYQLDRALRIDVFNLTATTDAQTDEDEVELQGIARIFFELPTTAGAATTTTGSAPAPTESPSPTATP
jgi:Tfp pilus assembly protein PilO